MGPTGAERNPAKWRRLLRAGSLGAACFVRSERVPAHPLRLALEPSTHCPLDCATCARAERTPDPRHIDPAFFGAILADVSPRIVHLHGAGEPAAHPELPRLCADARATGARVALLTSLTDAGSIARVIDALPFLDRIQIGMDAVTPEVYRRVRRGGDFDLLRSGVRSILQARSRSGAGRPSVILSFLLLERNLHEAVPFVREARQAGADGIVFLPVDLLGIEERTADLVGALRGEDVARTVREAGRAAEAEGVRSNAELLLDPPFLLAHRYGGGPLPGGKRCLRPWFSTFVTVDGEVRPCSRYAYEPQAGLGSLRASSFSSIWNGAPYRAVRRGLAAGRLVHEPCGRCPGPYEEGGLIGNLLRRRRSP